MQSYFNYVFSVRIQTLYAILRAPFGAAWLFNGSAFLEGKQQLIFCLVFVTENGVMNLASLKDLMSKPEGGGVAAGVKASLVESGNCF